MKKIILVATLALAPFIFANDAFANPNKQNIQHSQHLKHKKHKHKKIKKIEDKIDVAICNECFISTPDESPGEFFRKDRERTAALQAQIIVATKPIISKKVQLSLDLDEQRRKIAKECSWFTCDFTYEVTMEAKKWEGKSTKSDRNELKDLLSVGNNQPVDPARIPWCAAFANAILNRLGYETTNSLTARSFMTWGKKTNEPQSGDIVVLRRGHNGWSGHVGFFEGFETVGGVKYVKVLGGNTDKAVQVGYFPVDKVLGFRKAA